MNKKYLPTNSIQDIINGNHSSLGNLVGLSLLFCSQWVMECSHFHYQSNAQIYVYCKHHIHGMGILQIHKNAHCACAGNAGNVSQPPRVSDPDMHHDTCVTLVPWCMLGSLTSGFLWSRWREKRSRHSRCMRNQQFYVTDKRPMETYCNWNLSQGRLHPIRQYRYRACVIDIKWCAS